MSRCFTLKQSSTLTTLKYILGALYIAIWNRCPKNKLGTMLFTWRLVVYVFQIAFVCLLIGKRGLILAAVYMWARVIDDTLDVSMSHENQDRKLSYCHERMEILRSVLDGQKVKTGNLEDSLLLYVIEQGRICNFDISKDLIKTLELIQWDVEHSYGDVLTQKQLEDDWVSQEKHIIGLAATVLGADKEKYCDMYFVRTGLLSRTDAFNDLASDLPLGTINIPIEAIQSYNINLKQLMSCKAFSEMLSVPGFKAWYKSEFDYLTKEWKIADQDFRVKIKETMPNFIMRKVFYLGFVHVFHTSLLHQQLK